jgi:hypothetical protein
MTRTSIGLLPALAAIALAAGTPVLAQDGRVGSAAAPPSAPTRPAGGWNITPSLLYSGSWDDNVMLKGRGDQPVGDFLNVLNPRADAEFTGRRGQFSGKYDGAFLLYRDLNTLNSYDQHAGVSARRLLSKHVTLFVIDTVAVMPTTELALLVGVPFVRTGANVNDLRSGIEADVTKRTSIKVTYHFEWVRFDQNTVFGGTSLLGGHSHGGVFSLRHQLSHFTALTVDYDRQHSTAGGPETFDIQNVAAGFDRTLTEALRIFAAAGISRLADSALGPGLTSPRYHAGVSQRLRTGSLDVVYDRAFAPSFGLGGTTDSADLSVRLNMPLTRKIYTQSGFSWRTNNYLQVLHILAVRDASLKSRWVEGSIGYLVQPWMRVEGFYGGAYQTTNLPGGAIDRTRFGVQVITTKPMRIR